MEEGYVGVYGREEVDLGKDISGMLPLKMDEDIKNGKKSFGSIGKYYYV